MYWHDQSNTMSIRLCNVYFHASFYMLCGVGNLLLYELEVRHILESEGDYKMHAVMLQKLDISSRKRISRATLV